MKSRFTALPKLVDVDYRVDLIKEPVLKLNLTVEDPEIDTHIKKTCLELSKGQLSEILNNLQRIDDQLKGSAGK